MIAAIVNVVSKFEPFIIKIDGGVLNVGIDQLHIALQQHIALKRCDTKCIEIDTVLKSVVARRLPYRCVLVRLPESNTLGKEACVTLFVPPWSLKQAHVRQYGSKLALEQLTIPNFSSHPH
jgi:phosphopantetheinyl transferase